jgi:CubicO group peptidase (beta-lactamase class C family)
VHAQRVDDFVPLKIIEGDTTEASLNTNNESMLWPTNGWEKATPVEMGMDSTKLMQAKNYATSAGGGSGLITRGGKAVMWWGSQTQRYDLKSTTKSIGVTALGLAIKDNLMNLSDKAQEYHPSIGVPPSSNKKSGWLSTITIEHLATQTAGFDKPAGYESLRFKPGTKWFYSDGGPNWLAEAITLVYQDDLKNVMFNRVFSHLGIDITGSAADLTWRNNTRREDLNGIENREFGSGMSANVDAMARIGYLYLRNGLWEGQQLIPQSFVDIATQPRPGVAALPLHDPDHWPGSPKHYGLLWWNNGDGTLPDVPKDAYWSWGLGDSLIIVIPSLDIVASRAGNSWQSGWNADYSIIEPFITPIAQSALGDP